MRLNRFCVIAAIGLALTACASKEPPPQNFPDIRFDTSMPLRLDVSRIQVVAQFQPSFKPPEVEYSFPVPPQRAIENWAHDRLQAADVTNMNTVRVTILDASVRENPSPPIKDQDTRYDARLEVRVEVLDDHGFAVRTANAVSERSRSEPSSSSPNQLDSVYYVLTKDVSADLTKELERQIKESFYPYLLQ